MFEAALSACIRIEEDDQEDSDALVTTISFNLGRSYESRGLSEKAVEVYEGLLKRHDDYIDARGPFGISQVAEESYQRRAGCRRQAVSG